MAEGRVTTFIALLRGINLGPRNKIAMADLRDLLDGLGHGDVRTHILSSKASRSQSPRATTVSPPNASGSPTWYVSAISFQALKPG